MEAHDSETFLHHDTPDPEAKVFLLFGPFFVFPLFLF
jgi:hypothetical protein